VVGSHKKAKRREDLLLPRFFLWGDLSEVLLRGEPELDTAVFENDHERVGVTRVQIATVHVAVNRWLFSSVKMLLGNKFRYQLEAILEIVTARRSQRLSRL
jgi:hypothetical protein